MKNIIDLVFALAESRCNLVNFYEYEEWTNLPQCAAFAERNRSPERVAMVPLLRCAVKGPQGPIAGPVREHVYGPRKILTAGVGPLMSGVGADA